MADDWSIIRKYKANLKKFGGIKTNLNKLQSMMLTVYTKAEANRLYNLIIKKANRIGAKGGDSWWDLTSSIVVDGGKRKYNQALKMYGKNKDGIYEMGDWANKQHRAKKILLYENYTYPLQACLWLFPISGVPSFKDEYFTNFRRYCKGKKMKDKKYQKAYEKWLADKEKKKTTKRKTPAKKKTTKRKRKTAPKKSGRILRGKRKSPSTSATSVSVGTKRRGGDGKMYVCKTYKRGNKRVKRWFKV